MIIYFGYGIKNSSLEESRTKSEQVDDNNHRPNNFRQTFINQTGNNDKANPTLQTIELEIPKSRVMNVVRPQPGSSPYTRPTPVPPPRPQAMSKPKPKPPIPPRPASFDRQNSNATSTATDPTSRNQSVDYKYQWEQFE